MDQAETLKCPKCQAAMRSYERSGVVVDRCTECGGIFLDRGELERVMDAEAAYNADRGWSTRADEEDWDGDRGRGRRRGGFLGDLLDLG